MSLLMDALKQAEQAKQANRSADHPTPTAAGGGASGGIGAAAAPANNAQRAANNVFNVKSNSPRVHANRPLILLLGGVGLLVLAAGGFYLWYSLAFPALSYAPPVAQLPLQLAPSGARAPVSALPPADRRPAAPSVPTANATSAEGDSRAASAPAKPIRRPASVAATRPDIALEPAPPAKTMLDPELASAYQALTAGDWANARSLYLRVLQHDPISLDAQLGLATASAALGDAAGAMGHYQQALALDPKNPSALAGLAGLRGARAGSTSESSLRSQLAQQPGAAPLHFALGNLLAAEARWSEAQQAYFNAHRLAPDDPDHAYNLAVSLDHLNQPKLAADYYQRALKLAAGRHSQFDPAAANRRVLELSR